MIMYTLNKMAGNFIKVCHRPETQQIKASLFGDKQLLTRKYEDMQNKKYK